MVRKFILQKSPRSMDDWDACFEEMKTKLISRLLDGQKEYEYITYPESIDCDNIYTKKHHQPKLMRPKGGKEPKGHRKPNYPQDPRNPRKRKYQKDFDSWDKKGRKGYDHRPPRKKYRGDVQCKRCRRTGHYVKDCFAEYDVDRNPINSPPPKTRKPSNKCNICGLRGHNPRSCYWRNQDGNNPKDKKEFTQYGSANKQQNDQKSNEPEINVMNKPHDVTSAFAMIKQWSENADMNDSTRDDLLQFMNEIKSSALKSQ